MSGTGPRRTVQRVEAEAALEGVQARVGRLALQQAHQLRGLRLAARHGALEVHRAPDLQVALACTVCPGNQALFPGFWASAWLHGMAPVTSTGRRIFRLLLPARYGPELTCRAADSETHMYEI